MKIFTIKVGMIGTNCYVLIGETGTTWVIDPGADSKKILEILDKEQVQPTKILLTHGHFDHIEAVARIKQLFPDIKVYVHLEDVPFLQNNKTWENYLGRALISAPYDENIQDGDCITEDDLQAKVISTPGHSAGSVCYVIGNNLFSGDTVFAYGGVGRTDLWNSSGLAMRTSLKKIFSLEQDFVMYPGHGPSSTLEQEKSYRR